MTAEQPSAVDRIRGAMPFAALLGIDFLEATPAAVTARLAWQPSLCTSGEVLHGGALMALADSTGAACAVINLPEGAAGTATIESKTNFFRAVRGGHVDAVSVPLHVGRATIVVETDLHDASGKRVAKVIQTQAVLTAA